MLGWALNLDFAGGSAAVVTEVSDVAGDSILVLESESPTRITMAVEGVSQVILEAEEDTRI
jgi:hypothetical protein